MSLTGKQIRQLLRVNHLTIREFSQRAGITMKRVREACDKGLTERGACRDWIQIATGTDPGPDWELPL